ncbi:MAG: PAS domain S-box protein [Desulfobacterium sp.]|nr:PAS domain S-box protein [Desulfobacterium sp.]
MLQTKGKKLSFGTTLISIFVILIVVTAGLIGYISFRNGEKAAKNMANQIQNSIQYRIEQDLNNFLAKPHAFNQINADAIRSGLVGPRDLVDLRMQFLHQIKAVDSMISCAFGSEAGDFTSAGRRSEGGFDTAMADKRLDNNYYVSLLDEQGDPAEVIKVVEDYHPRPRPWYQAAIKANGPTWSPVYVWASQRNIGISAVQPVYHNTGELLGVQLSALSLEDIGQFLQNISVENTVQIFIIERSGLLVASSMSVSLLQENVNESEVRLQRVSAIHSTNPLIRETTNYLNEQFTGIDHISNKQRMEIEVEGVRYFSSVTPFADEHGLDWLIIIDIPESILMGAVEANARSTIFLGLSILAGTLILGIGLTRRITRPIIYLTNSLKSFANGELDTFVDMDRSDEIGELAAGFNKMAKQIKDSFEIIEKKVQERTAALSEANIALQDSENRYRSLSDAAFEGIVITAKGKILEANDTFCEMLGYQSSELVDKAATDLVPLEKREYVNSKMQYGFEQPYESSFLRKDGSTFPAEVHAKMFLYKGQLVRVSAIRDISEHKKAKEEREKIINELQMTLAEVNTLRGIIPICASCKKIRDDKGYWNQVETYIEKFFDARFSHGMCEECEEKYYGDQEWFKKVKRNRKKE